MHPVHHPMRTNHHCGHRGFTLIELLVAIGIVAILAGLLLTGVQSARRAVVVAKVAQEIRSFETAIASFHSEFGVYPPSSITLHDTLAGWNADQTSKAKITSIWPQFDFAKSRDFDGDGTEDFISLDGANCLVFFLAGIIRSDGAPIGFAVNPRDPFSLGGTNRHGPYFEFDLSRLVPRGNGFAYLDSFPGQTNPIWYISSNNGIGYSVIDPSGAMPPRSPHRLELPPPPSDPAIHRMTDCYRQTFSFADEDADLVLEIPFDNSSFSFPPAWKDNGFQIISPGPDGIYGIGGYYREGMARPKRPAWISSDAEWDRVWQLFLKYRVYDQDNVTTFKTNLN